MNNTAPVNARARPTNHDGGADHAGCAGMLKSVASAESSMALNARTIVTQLSQAKLPDATSHSWVTTTMPAATLATGCGANNPNGTTSWAKWLPATSTRCSGLGRWWKNQLNGPGMGWVSWW